MTDDPGCSVCPLAPCNLTPDECMAFWKMVEIFQTLTYERMEIRVLSEKANKNDS